MRTFTRCFLFVLAIASLSGCGQSSEVSSVAPTVETKSFTGLSKDIESATYYKGGFYPAPGMPNWSNNSELILNPDFSAEMSAAIATDNYCGRNGTLDQPTTLNLLEMIDTLTLRTSTGVIGADFGIELLTLKYNDGTTRKIYLDRIEAPNKSTYAENGAALSAAIQNAETALQTYCQ